MKLQSVIRKMETAGAEVAIKTGEMYVAKFEKASIEFINDEGEVSNFYVINNTLKDDIQSDYFAGRFARNVKHAIELVKAHE